MALGDLAYFHATESAYGDELCYLDDVPAVTQVFSTSSNGTYSTGQSVSISLAFSETVTLTGGNLSLTLNSGAIVSIAPFTGKTVAATYVVGVNDTTPHLDVLSISLSGAATLRDASNNNAILTRPLSDLAKNSNIIVNPQLPTVALLIVNSGLSQRSRLTSVTVAFSVPIDATQLNQVVLTRTAGDTVGTVVQTGAVGPNGRIIVSPATGLVSSVTLTFDNADGSPMSAGVENGSLADGRWQLSIPYLNYTSPLNDPNLRRLFGDSNNDGTVDGTDFADFGTAFGQTVANSPFDFNGDGTVDGTDFAEFGTRFGMTL